MNDKGQVSAVQAMIEMFTAEVATEVVKKLDLPPNLPDASRRLVEISAQAGAVTMIEMLMHDGLIDGGRLGVWMAEHYA